MFSRMLKFFYCVNCYSANAKDDLISFTFSVGISSLELEKSEFFLGSVINAVVSQVMLLLRERSLQLIRDIPEEIKTLAVCGDQARIQQVLADFLLNMVRYAPTTEGWVEIHVRPTLKQISEGLTILHAEFRYVALISFYVICN